MDSTNLIRKMQHERIVDKKRIAELKKKVTRQEQLLNKYGISTVIPECVLDDLNCLIDKEKELAKEAGE